MIVQDEITIREERLANLAQAKAVLEERAKERYETEQAEYEAKLREREKKARKHRHKPKGRPPQPPEQGHGIKISTISLDPDSHIMKNSNNKGVDQHYNVQVAADQECLLIIANGLSNHPNDKKKLCQPWMPLPHSWANPRRRPWTTVISVKPNIQAFQKREVEAYIATGREPHHKDWRTFFAELPEPPGEDASPKEKMAYKLQTEIGKGIYRLRQMHR